MTTNYYTESTFQMIFNVGIILIIFDYIIQRVIHYNDYKLFQKIIVHNEQQFAYALENMSKTYTKKLEKCYDDLNSLEKRFTGLITLEYEKFESTSKVMNDNLIREIGFVRESVIENSDRMSNLEILRKEIKSVNEYVECIKKMVIAIENKHYDLKKFVDIDISDVLKDYCEKREKILELEDKNNEFENKISELLEQQNNSIADLYCGLESFTCCSDPFMERTERNIYYRLTIAIKKTNKNFDFDKYYRENQSRFIELKK